MEQLNKLELRGNVGFSRVQVFNSRKVARFSVATNYAYKDRDGMPVIETTWHNVSAWEGRDIVDPELIRKGTKVHVIGRLRAQNYTDKDGQERDTFEVLATKVELLEDLDQPQNDF
ncbi:MAG: single-stranded DNA-binding protein [Bacteroidales bacterium]|jgi:single-strand DNA-binding protein|nr:single-stranded DNA-binding protein [Bacteroidales bacterium]MBP5389564.1 single-stranded DNA-binding protein [Bacteroidales bacterium]MBP5635039.1 single-stranded DNA-binding protein [Bacteroidales bacterium]